MLFLEMFCGYRVYWVGVFDLVLLTMMFAKLPMSSKNADSAIYSRQCWDRSYYVQRER